MASLFGFEIKRTKEKDEVESFAPKLNDDGAINVEATATGGSYGHFLDIEGNAKTEGELVTRYRSMSLQPEIQQAVDEVVNEAISVDTNERVVSLVLDDVEMPEKIKKQMIEEFDQILRLFDFSNQGYDIFQRFYVDGRINYHVIIDEDKPKKGILEMRYLDPRKIRFIRETDSSKTHDKTGVAIKKIKKEYYMYSETGFGTSNAIGTANQGVNGFRIAKDSIARVTSGIMNENQSMVLSHLHRAIKPLNQLRTIEDANVIYTLTRAPERRIFYVDVGNLPKAKAEQYLADMMARHKNKLSYNSSTGEMSDQRNFMTMTEDFWFPRREGNRSTEVDTLAGGASLSDNDQLPYFQKKLFKSLVVPVSRLDPESQFSFGRVSEMSREEIKFGKFVRRLRSRFSILFDIVLEKQLILRGILTPDEWDEIKDYVRFDFMKDNYFEELKQMEILRERMNTLREVEEHVGKYFSREYVQRNVLFMTDEEIEEMAKQIDKERKEEDGDGDDEFGGFGDSYGDKPVDKPDKPPEQDRPDDSNSPADKSVDELNETFHGFLNVRKEFERL
jgi:hypothetical protein